jgi:DNA-binding SARP family transcriptional activator
MEASVVGTRDRDQPEGLTPLLPPENPTLRLSLLRGFELSCDGAVIPMVMSAQRLLAFLALQDRALPRAYIAGLLWGDVPENRAFGNLRSALWRLRLPALSAVEGVNDHLRLSSAVSVDVRDAHGVARRLLAGSCPCPGESVDQRAFEGELLPGWYEDWILIERERHRQLSLHALETLCERLSAAGRFGEAVLAGMAAVAAEPLRESAQRVLIRTHLREGNPGEAIRQYRLYGELLHEELGLRPSQAITELVREIEAG